ncbi:MAG: hypothetical protein ABI178_05110 [Rhodanobacter sp.]
MNRHLILAMRRPQLDITVVPGHLDYLDGLRTQDRLLVLLAGPFGHQPAGACLQHAADLAQATAVAHDNPAGWQLPVQEWRAK